MTIFETWMKDPFFAKKMGKELVAMKKEEALVGKHDFNGSYAPVLGCDWSRSTTFSVGIFEWIPAKSGGLKKSKVKVRVGGLTANPEPVYARARSIAKKLDAGTYKGPKIVYVE